jgi:hypothetical protein
MHLMNQDRNLIGPGYRPFISPSGYNPADEKKRYESELYDVAGPGISEHNKNYFGTTGRRRELEKAIAENRDYTGQAYKELQELNRRHQADAQAREGYFRGLGASQGYNQDMIRQIGERQAELERQRTSLWGLPRRMWLRLRGQDPNAYFDHQISSLEGSAAHARREADLSRDSIRMLNAGYVGREKRPTSDINALKQQFFPTE